MKLRDMPNTLDGRFRYWKCANQGDCMFTLVRFSGGIEEDFLKSQFSTVELSEHYLPAYRLMEVEL